MSLQSKRTEVEATEGQKESTFYSETLMVSTQVPGDDTKQGERGKLEDLTWNQKEQ